MVGREKPLALVHIRHTHHEVLLPLRHQFPILQREFFASAPEVRFFAFVRTNVIWELTQAEVGGNVGEVCSLVVSLLPISLHYAGVVARFFLIWLI